MTKWIVIVTGGLILASCNPNGDAAKSPESKTETAIAKSVGDNVPPAEKVTANTVSVVPAANSETSNSNSAEKKMIEHELLSYFQASESGVYANCNSEKSAIDDYEAGKVIPKTLVKKYRLYKFNISPTVGLKFKKDSPKVEVKGGQMMKHQDKTILIYHVGIGLTGDEIMPNEGVDTRALVLDANGEKFANYFVGGYVKEDGVPEKTVCRTVTFKGDEMVLKLNEEDGPGGPPSHLKLMAEETRDLK